MTDSTNNSFEKQWQHAFDNAELTPPESVWEKIELGLKPENTLPSKPNFVNKPYYFLGGIIVGLIGLFLWFNNTEKQVQDVEKEEVKVEKTVVQNKLDILQKVHGAKEISHGDKKVVDVVGGDTNHGAKEKNVVEVIGGDTNHGEGEAQATIIEEVPIRTLTDSVEMIEPLATKSIHAEIENPTINLPTDQTPYYVKPLPKPQKKSIFKNVKISVGAGVYQQ
jgi:hypothetical protein